MAIIKKSLLGAFTGKVGGIIGYELNGQHVIRSAPSYTKRAPSALTLINRAKMKAVSQFLKPLKTILAYGYRQVSPPGSRIGTFQAAQSYTFKNAITYAGDQTPVVDPTKVLILRGDLKPPQQVQATRGTDGVTIAWDPSQLDNQGQMVFAVAYSPENEFVRIQKDGANASSGILNWLLEPHILDTFPSFHIYVGFYDVMHDQLSDSVYAGEV